MERIVAGLGSRHLIKAAPQRGWRAIEPYHDRVREVVQEDIAPDQRRGLHRRVAEALEAAEPSDAQALVEHWLGAGDERRAARCAKVAAEQAMAALAFDRAAQMLRQVLELGELSGPEWSEVQERLGDALGQAGRGVESADAYLAALKETDAERALDLERRAGEQLMRAGRYEQGLAALRHVLSRLGVSVPRTWWASLISIVKNQFAYLFARVRRSSSRKSSSPAQVAFDASWAFSLTALLIDPIGAAAVHSRSRVLAIRSGSESLVTRSATMQILLWFTTPRTAWSGSYEKGFDDLFRHVESDSYLSALLLFSRTVSSHFVGEYTKALRQLDATTVALQRCGRSIGFEASTLSLARLWLLFYLGEYAELSKRTVSAMRRAKDYGNRYAEDVSSTGWPGFAWLVSDEPARLRGQAIRASERDQVGYRDYVSYWRAMSLLQAAVYENRIDEALGAVKLLDTTLRPWLPGNPPMVTLELWHLKATAALEEALSGSDARRRLRKAERLASKIARLPVGRVRHVAYLLHAAVAAQRREMNLAEQLLRSACDELGEVAGYRAAGQWRLGKLIGGEEGAEFVREANSFFEAQQVKNPARLVRVLAPGFVEDPRTASSHR